MPEYIEIALRAALAYFSLILLTKLMGKRQISQLNFFDYVVGIIIGSLTANSILRTDKNLFLLLIAVVVIALLEYIISIFTLKVPAVRSFFEGKKTLLIENGKLITKNANKERLNIDRIESLLRDKEVFDIKDVVYGYFETTGKISVLKKKNQ